MTATSDVVYRMSPDWSEMRQLDGRGFLSDTAEPTGSWMEGYIPAEDQPAVREAIERAVRSGMPFELEHRVIRADGTSGWTASRAVPILGADGQVTEWLGAAADVTGRKQTEQALRGSEELRRIAVEGGGMGTWRWDLRDGLIWGDAVFLGLWGFPPSDEPRPLSDFTDRMSPHGQAEMGEMVTHAIKAEEAFDGQLEVVSGRTKGHWVRWRGRAERERPWIINGISFDVTDQRARDEHLREREERQAFLLKLSDALRAEEGVKAVGDAAVRMLAEQLDLDRVYIVTVDTGEDDVVVIHEGRPESMSPLLGSYRGSDFPNAVKEIFERTVVIEDVRTDVRLSELDRLSFTGLDARGFIGVPIRRGSEELIWVVGAVSTKPPRWTAAEITLLEEAAERTWGAIERARAEAALREGEQAMAANLAGTSLLRDLSERLGTEEDLATIHEEVLAAAIAITLSDGGTIQVYEPETRSLNLLVTRGFDRGMTDYFGRVDAKSETACGAALREGRRTFISFDKDRTDEASRMHVAAGYRSAQATPLLSRAGVPLGMLNTHWRKSGHKPSDRELRLLDLLARQAADLIERAQAHQRLSDSEERLRQFGEASQDVLWIRDARTLQWRYLTPAFETIYGLSREEALSGDNYRCWLDLILPRRSRARFGDDRPGGGGRVGEL